MRKLCEGLDATKIDKDGLEQPDNMARSAFIGKAFQFLPRIQEMVDELGTEAETLNEGESELLAQITSKLEDEHLG